MKLRKWKMWVGFVNDRPDLDYVVNGDTVYGAVYPARYLAPYDDVRRVEVRELPRKVGK